MNKISYFNLTINYYLVSTDNFSEKVKVILQKHGGCRLPTGNNMKYLDIATNKETWQIMDYQGARMRNLRRSDRS